MTTKDRIYTFAALWIVSLIIGFAMALTIPDWQFSLEATPFVAAFIAWIFTLAVESAQ